MKYITFEHISGLTKYNEIWDYQKNIVDSLLSQCSVNSDETPVGHLIFNEHYPVYTLGKNGNEKNLLINLSINKMDAEFVRTDRGGDITFHGPGQLVGYPIFNLKKLNIGIKQYVYLIEQSIIDTLEEFNIKAERLDKAVGVWIDANTPQARKICAIGIKVSHGITMHGFAFNINTDLNYFNYINPCGFVDKGVTSLEKELKQKQDFKYVCSRVLENIKKNFAVEILK